jgi:hypothetical protein
MWLWLALGALFAGTGVVLRERAKAGTVAAPLLAPGSFGDLENGRLYRVWVKLASGYGKDDEIENLERDLTGKIQDLGFSEVLLANEDPTDDRVWTFLARWGQETPGGVNVPPISVYQTEEVNEPEAAGLYPRTPPSLDQSLSFAEANAVSVALERETDPAMLFDFAKAMAGDFPVAQSLLKAKAGILVKPVTPQSTAAFHAIEAAGSIPITSESAPPMAKAALLDYYARAGISPGTG